MQYVAQWTVEGVGLQAIMTTAKAEAYTFQKTPKVRVQSQLGQGTFVPNKMIYMNLRGSTMWWNGSLVSRTWIQILVLFLVYELGQIFSYHLKNEGNVVYFLKMQQGL